VRIFAVIIGMLFSLPVYSGVTEWVSFEGKRNNVGIPVLIEGIEATAVINTGFISSSISESFLKKHKLQLETNRWAPLKSGHSSYERQIYENVAVEMFGIEIAPDLVGAASDDYDADLTIGSNLLEHFIVQIDYPNKQMRLLTRDAVDLAEIANIEMQGTEKYSYPALKLLLNDESDVWLVLSTVASTGIYINRLVVESNGWLSDYSSKVIRVATDEETLTAENFRLPKLKIGPYELENVSVTVPSKGNNLDFGTNFTPGTGRKAKKLSGVVGYKVLKHFVLTVDLKKGIGHIYAPE